MSIFVMLPACKSQGQFSTFTTEPVPFLKGLLWPMLLQVLLNGRQFIDTRRAKASLVIDEHQVGILNVSSDDRLDNF
jgi:hypothetical protein